MNIADALKVLDIQSESPKIEEIKKSYRIQQLKWHPDLHVGKTTISEAVERSPEINNAYEILTELYEQNGTIKFTAEEKNKTFRPLHQYAKKTFTPGFSDESVFEVFVKSSHIVSTGYNPINRILYIKFSHDAVYMYFDVPNSIFDEFINASSYGKYAHKNIYWSFKYKRCTEPNGSYSGPKIDKNESNRLYLTGA